MNVGFRTANEALQQPHIFFQFLVLKCQRVKKEVFKSDGDYVEALKAHHAVMQCAMKAKQSMDTAACDALDHAIADMAKMYLPVA